MVEVGAGLVGLAEACGQPGSPQAGFGVVRGHPDSLVNAAGAFCDLLFKGSAWPPTADCG